MFILDLRSDSKGIEIPAISRVSITTMTHDTNIGGGGGLSGLNDKPDTDGQPYLTISYSSQGFQIILYD